MLDLVNEVTRILSAIDQGAPHAAVQLLPLVYDASNSGWSTRLGLEALLTR
jgi:hypothetical protein